MTTPKPWQCPECAGPWLYNFTIRHVPNGCTIGAREDATQGADEEWLNDGYSLHQREATGAEMQLLEYFTGSPVTVDPESPPMTLVERRVPGIRRRTVAGINPDTLGEAP